MQSWLEGRKWVGKGAQATRLTASLRIQSSKADSNTWDSFTRSGLKLESVHQESPRSDVFRKRATKPLLNQKQRQKHLTWATEKKNWTVAQCSKVLFLDKSKFCISFGTLCFHLLTSFMEMLISFTSRTLAPTQSDKTTSKWFADHDITVLDWPANMPDLNPIWNLWNIFKRTMRNSWSNNTDELEAQ